jgi:hypothetical protein
VLVYSTSPDTSGLPVRVGLYFEPELWDGSDFFVPDNMGTIIVTERVRAALTSGKITNAEITPLPQWVGPIIPESTESDLAED